MMDSTSYAESSFTMVNANTEEEHVVGFDDEVTELVGQLIGNGTEKNLEVISIVGMAGIGKTTLAREVYNHSYIEYYFYVRAWTSVSQVYSKRDNLLALLSCMIYPMHDIYRMSDDELSVKLRNSLMGNRYLIVMDDIWDIGAWDDLKRSFPDNRDGSRVIFTSRLKDVPSSHAHCRSLLSEDDSWELFQQRVFKEESCPSELMKLGKQITLKCHGLPLAVVVIAGLVATTKTVDWWSEVSRDMDSHNVNDNKKHYLDILELSYSHLPHHLKACFLYFGAFPEDLEVPARRLVWMWMAEGFIPESDTTSLEDTAEGYLADLISRSLVMISKRRSDGGVKLCRIHDLWRELCLSIAKEESHMQQTCWYKNEPDCLYVHPCACRHQPYATYTPNVLSPSGVGYGMPHIRNLSICQDFKCLRVLDLASFTFSSFPNEITSLVNLRYIAVKAVNIAPQPDISNLFLLQTLILYPLVELTFPDGIWTISTLRHVCLKPEELVNEKLCFEEGQITDSITLANLHTLSHVSPSRSCLNILQRSPNLKKLGLRGDFMPTSGDFIFPNLSFSSHLERLKMHHRPKNWRSARSFTPINFPVSLRMLTLEYTLLPWSVMHTLGLLRNLEFLKLKSMACYGNIWETTDGGFQNLKFLKFQDLNIVQWIATSTQFPLLEHLVLDSCEHLEEIPLGLGDVATLAMIEIRCCNESTEVSAIKMKKDQEDKGNDWPVIHVNRTLDKTRTKESEEQLMNDQFITKFLLVGGPSY